MKIDVKEIIRRLEADFKSTYRPYAYFTSNPLWIMCIETVKNVKLMNNIIFCNDVLLLPPVKVFLMSNNNLSDLTTDYEKKAIGAFWGFVFKFVFGYISQKEISISTKGVKSAAYFYGCNKNVEVV